ncbi:MAG: sphingomyelin phosphodiesterase, partial [Myxococcota bacterium]|nr:sphingomyelin phosphodiesterase [Myxococcota bacterium]
EIEVEAFGWRPVATPLVLRLRLDGALVGSRLGHGMLGVEGVGSSWVHDRTVHRGMWRLVGASVEVSMWAFFAGSEDDIEVVLHEAPGLPRGNAPWMPESWRSRHLDVLSYNVFMRPRDAPPYTTINGQGIRAALIPPRLVGYDVLVLQEAFDNDARKTLLEGLANHGYPHASQILGSDDLTIRWKLGEGPQVPKNWNGGVVIASKWPIVEGSEAQLLFGGVCGAEDCGADKGAVHVTIDKGPAGGPPMPFHIIGTHLNNGDWEVQKGQLELIRRFIDALDIPPNEPVVIAGDFNVNRVTHPEYHRAMLEILGAKDPCPFVGGCGYRYTADGSVNDLDAGGGIHVDYTLYSSRHLGSTSGTFAETRVYRALEEWREFAHESAMWDLSDHFAVYGSFLFMPR